MFKKGDWVCVNLSNKSGVYYNEEGLEVECEDVWSDPIPLEEDTFLSEITKSWTIKLKSRVYPMRAFFQEKDVRIATLNDFENKILKIKKNMEKEEINLSEAFNDLENWKKNEIL